MSVVFIILVCSGASYFLFVKRRFDFFALAFFSAAVYFIPGWVGHVPDLVNWVTWADLTKRVSLADGTYLVMSVVLVAIWLGAAVSDMAPDVQSLKFCLQTQPYAMYVALSIAVVGVVLTVATVGSTLLTDDKRVLLGAMNRWHVLWTWGACLATVMGFLYRHYLTIICGFSVLAVDLYLGFRAPLVLTFLALITLHLHAQGRQRLAVKHKRMVVLGLLVTGAVLLYPTIWAYGRAGDITGLSKALLNEQTYASAILLGEPFITQAVLNEIVRSGFYIGPGHLMDSLLAVGVFAPDLGVSPTSFNDLFQPALFPNVNGYGLGNNIWAQMYASGGMSALGVFLGLFVLTLSAGGYLLRARDRQFVALVAVAWVLVAFYLNRNDLLVHINFEKQLWAIWMLCVSGGLLLRQATETAAPGFAVDLTRDHSRPRPRR